MIRSLFTLVFVFFACSASGQGLVVRSGEHADFSRLVMPLPQGDAWSLEYADDAYEVRIGEGETQFDVGRIFDRIPRTRILDAQSEEGVLIIKLGCECRADAFVFRDRNLVIDVRSGVPDQATVEEEVEQAEVVLPQIPLLPIVGGLSALPTTQPQQEDDAVVRLEVDAQMRLNETNVAVAEGIARAASQGLLAPRSALPVRAADETEDIQEAPPQVPHAYPKDGQFAVRAETSIERSADQMRVGSHFDGSFAGCRPEAEFDVASWGEDGRSFPAQMGNVWSEATVALDGDASEAMRQIARKYIYFGFGAEALQALSQTDDASAEAVSLRDIATVIDNPRDAPLSGLLHDQVGCDTPAALWAVLATRNIPNPDRIAKPALLQAFQSLPLHLRLHLGPPLSDRFLRAGDAATADALSRFLSRAVAEENPGMLLNRAHLEVANGDHDAASALLSEVITSSDPASLQAIIEMVYLHLDNGWRIKPEVAELIAARAFEMRHDDVGRELAAVHVLSLAMAGDFDAAMESLQGHMDLGDMPQALAAKITTLVTTQADDVPFLKFALNPEYALLGAPDLALEERLMSLGFAEEVIRRLDQAEPSVPARHLQARAHLALDDAVGAMSVLGDLEGPIAASIRADALELITVSAAPDRPIDPWLEGDWATLAASGEAPLANAADWMSDRLPAGPPAARAQSELVDASEDVLKGSATDRDAVKELLARFPGWPAEAQPDG